MNTLDSNTDSELLRILPCPQAKAVPGAWEGGEDLHAGCSGAKTGRQGSGDLHPALTWCCASLRLARDSREERGNALGFSHLTSIVTPQRRSVLLFFFML